MLLPRYSSSGNREGLKGGPTKGRRVELGTAEEAALRVAYDFRGAEALFFITTIRGPRIDRSTLERAARLLQKRHRILACHVRRDFLGRFYLEEDPEVRIPVHERVMVDCQTTHRKIFREELNANHQLNTAEIYLIQPPVGSDQGIRQIGVYLQHWFCDGTSMINVVNRLLEAALGSTSTLDETSVEFQPWNMDADSKLTQAFLKNDPNRLSLAKTIVQIAMTCVKAFYNPFAPSWHQLPSDPKFLNLPVERQLEATQNYAFMTQLSENESRRLLELCRRNNSTVTCIVSTALEEAFLMERKDASEASRVVAALILSTRAVGEATDEELSHFVGSKISHRNPSKCPDKLLDAASMWERSRCIKKQVTIQDQEKRANGLVTAMGMMTLPNRRIKPTFGLSSWSAKCPVKRQYGQYEVVDGELLQNVRHCFHPLVSMYTICDRLHISIFGQTPLFDAKTLRRVVENTATILRSRLLEGSQVVGASHRARL